MLQTAAPINKDNASEYSLRAHAKRKARLIRLESESRELAELKAALAVLPANVETKSEAYRLLRLRMQVEKQMDDCKDAKELAALTASHERLFKTWCVLTDTKQPGTSKGSKRQRPAEVQPLDLAAPTAPTDSRPLGWEYDG